MKRIMSYTIKPAREVPGSLHFKRVGIIPYFFNHIGEREVSPEVASTGSRDSPSGSRDSPSPSRHFIMMLDAKYKEWTDCGGSPKQRENWLDTAIRETREESRGFFRFTRNFVLNNGHIVWREDFRIAVIFVNITKWMNCLIKARNLCNKYKLDYNKGLNDCDDTDRLENCEMEVYGEEELRSLCKEDKIYIPVRRLLQKLFLKKLHQETLVCV